MSNAAAVEYRPSVAKLAVALVAAQREIEGVSKNAENPHFKSKFADLTAVIEATVPVLNKHGIAVIQLPAKPDREGELALTTILLHESGEFLESTAHVPLAKDDPQGYGSAITYARRYSLGSAVGLKFLDDDAEAAVGRGGLPSTGERKAPPEKKPGIDFSKLRSNPPPAPQAPAKAPVKGKTALFPSVGRQEPVTQEWPKGVSESTAFRDAARTNARANADNLDEPTGEEVDNGDGND